MGPQYSSKWLNLLAAHHVLFEFGSIMNTTTVLVYWSLLHEESMKMPIYRDHPDRQIHNYFVHSAPAIFFVINWLISDVAMIASHCIVFVPVSIIYCYINYCAQLKLGAPLYDFMDWVGDFYGAIRNSILMNLFFIGLYVGMAKITQALKKDNKQTVANAA